MKTKRVRNLIVIPSSVTLTAKVVVGAANRLSTDKIRDLVCAGIEELDRRCGEPDFELDFDIEEELVV